jgi:hypothetical protein
MREARPLGELVRAIGDFAGTTRARNSLSLPISGAGR